MSVQRGVGQRGVLRVAVRVYGRGARRAAGAGRVRAARPARRAPRLHAREHGRRRRARQERCEPLFNQMVTRQRFHSSN